MKNLTRVLALVLVFSMMVTSVAFAKTFTDVEPTANYADAINVLSSLGILNGDPEGTFRPEADITRAEVTALVNRLQGLSDAAKAASGATAYTDVPADAWYAGDVNLGTQMGMIAGDGNGLFRPNDCIKYEEAVKLMVCAIGYDTKYADKQGGWPTGYLVIASNAGITAGINAATGVNATRGLVAKLAYNALTAPMMAFKSYSDYTGDATYAPQKAKTLLGEKLGYVKVTGNVVATPFTSLVSISSSLEDGTVDIMFDGAEAKETSVDSYYNKYVVGKLDVLDDFNANSTNNIQNVKVGKTDIMNALGGKVEAYIGLNDNEEPIVLAYIGNAKKNAEVALNGEFIQNTRVNKYPSDLESSVPYLSIYDDDNDTTNKTYNLEQYAAVILNGQYYCMAYEMTNTIGDNNVDFFDLLNNIEGSVKLIDSDNNNKYDYIFVTAYTTEIVEEVYGKDKKISFKSGNFIDLTNAVDGKEGYAYTLVNKDGKAVEIADLKEYDVLSIAPIFTNGIVDLPSNSKNYDIILCNDTVTGSVEAIDSSDMSDPKFTFAGTEYSVRPATNDFSMNNGDEGTIYLNAFGKIAYFDVTAAASKDYGFIVAADEVSSFGTSYEVKVLDKDGAVNIYTLADKVKIRNGASAWETKEDDDVYADYIATKVLSGKDWLLTDADGSNAEEYTANYASRIITFKKNTLNKITEITFAADGAGDAKKGLFCYDVTTGNEYSSKTNVFDNNIGVNDNTIVFDLSIDKNATEDDFVVGKINKLVDGNKYSIAFFQVDEDTNDAGVVLITNAGGSVGVNDALAVVTKIMETKNSDNDDVYTITFFQNGEEKTLTTTSDAASDFAGFSAGYIFEYRTDAKGDIEKANRVLPLEITNTKSISATAANNGLNRFAAGYVMSKTADRIEIKSFENLFDISARTDRHIVSKANVYVIDLTKSKISVESTELAEIPTTYVRDNGVPEEDRDSFAVVKYVDGGVVDVVVFKGFYNYVELDD